MSDPQSDVRARPAVPDEGRAGESQPQMPAHEARTRRPVRGAWIRPMINTATEAPHGLVVASDAMQRVLDLARRAAAARGGVLLRGEPGSGRRYLARAIHQMRTEPDAVLVEFDCASGGDAEMRLFGTRPAPGAATGRRVLERITRASALYNAFGGTLLLLNLPDLAARVQDRLLQVLRDREAAIVGNGTLRGDVRSFACVPASFRVSLDEGHVRPDLGKRLAMTCIDLPCLGDRRADIPALAEIFLREMAHLARGPVPSLTPPAVTLLSSLPYPGNARELREIVESAARQSNGRPIGLEELLPVLRFERLPRAGDAGPLRDARATFERQYIRDVLERHHGRIADAARVLGIQRPNLYRKMRLLGVNYVPRRP